MRERVSGLLGGSPRDLWVGTFHATGVRILRLKGQKIGIDPGFSIYDTDDQESLVKRILKELQLAEKDLTPKAARSAISAAKNALVSPTEFEERGADVSRREAWPRIYREYATRLRAANALDFDDLIGEPIRLFEEHPRRQRSLRRALPLRAGGRVPGHQRGPGEADRAPRLRAPQPLRGGRRRSVDLRMARRRHRQHPVFRAHVPRCQGHPPGAELPLDLDHSRRRQRGRAQQPGPQREDPLDGSGGRRLPSPHPGRRCGGRGAEGGAYGGRRGEPRGGAASRGWRSSTAPTPRAARSRPRSATPRCRTSWWEAPRSTSGAR